MQAVIASLQTIHLVPSAEGTLGVAQLVQMPKELQTLHSFTPHVRHFPFFYNEPEGQSFMQELPPTPTNLS